LKIAIIRNDGIGDLVLFNFYFSKLKLNESTIIDYYLTCPKDGLNYFKPKNVEPRYNFFQRPANFNFIQLLKFYLQIISIYFKKYDLIIVPVFSKNQYLNRYLDKLKTKKILTTESDDVNSKNQKIKWKSPLTLIEINNESELEKNLSLIEGIASEFSFNFFDNNFKIKSISPQSTKSIIIIAPFASDKIRVWPLINWIKIIEHLNKTTNNLKIAFVASKEEVNLFKKHVINNVSSSIDFSTINSSDIFLELILDCKLFIGMDSAPAHIASLNGIDTIVISNGNHYARFFPYPINFLEDGQILRIIIPPVLAKYDKDLIFNITKYGSNFGINDILVDFVIDQIDKILKK
jgi:ADP-heptose:LPS heptosyltransferase